METSQRSFTDRQGNRVFEGDRVRIVDGTGKTGFIRPGGEWESPVGWYVIIEKISFEISCIFAYKEGEPTFGFCVNAKDLVLAPVDTVQPEVLVHPAPSGAHDVRLVEHEISGAYSMYVVGNWEGTATLWHDTGRWEVSFKDATDGEIDAGSVHEHPNNESGAWSAWASVHPLLAS